jgi:hypothetical protein
MLISLSFIFLGRNMKPNEINGLTFKSDRLLEEPKQIFPFSEFPDMMLKSARRGRIERRCCRAARSGESGETKRSLSH